MSNMAAPDFSQLVVAAANTIAAHADEQTARRSCDHHLDAARYAVQIR